MFRTWLEKHGLMVILFYTNLLTSNAWRPYEIKLSNMTYSSASQTIQVNMTLNHSVIDAFINMKETIQDMYVRPEVYLDLGNGKYEFEFMNRTVDVCKLFRDNRYEPLLQLLYKLVLQYGNFPRKCPIQKQLYFLNQLRINTEKLPPVFPERKALILSKYFKKINQSLELLGVFTVVVTVEKKYKSSSNV